jgi:hypothetical protein
MLAGHRKHTGNRMLRGALKNRAQICPVPFNESGICMSSIRTFPVFQVTTQARTSSQTANVDSHYLLLTD